MRSQQHRALSEHPPDVLLLASPDAVRVLMMMGTPRANPIMQFSYRLLVNNKHVYEHT